VPVLGVTSFRDGDEVEQPLVDAVARQFEDLVRPLEEVAGTRLDAGRLESVMALSAECSRLWKACLETAAERPAPMSFFDGCIQMGPAVVLRGSQEACAYYRALLDELRQRVADGVAAVPGERFRLYWDGMPIWGKLRELSQLLERRATAVVASTYCNSWIFEALAEADPFVGMARAYAELFIVRDEDFKQGYLEQMARDYQIDAFVFHDAKTCPNNSNNRYGLPQRLTGSLSLPHVVIDGDLNDLRLYSEEQAVTQFEALIEQL
jgi:benzoyl-CoA reductase/2-hydroxyglutaryl-CoA dehydratase subunit BcrC/BadD/HgdB